MYYYNEQECILNAETRENKPDLFIPEGEEFQVRISKLIQDYLFQKKLLQINNAMCFMSTYFANKNTFAYLLLIF